MQGTLGNCVPASQTGRIIDVRSEAQCMDAATQENQTIHHTSPAGCGNQKCNKIILQLDELKDEMSHFSQVTSIKHRVRQKTGIEETKRRRQRRHEGNLNTNSTTAHVVDIKSTESILQRNYFEVLSYISGVPASVPNNECVHQLRSGKVGNVWSSFVVSRCNQML